MGTNPTSRPIRGPDIRIAPCAFVDGISAFTSGTGMAIMTAVKKNIARPVDRRDELRSARASPIRCSLIARDMRGNTAVVMDTAMIE